MFFLCLFVSKNFDELFRRIKKIFLSDFLEVYFNSISTSDVYKTPKWGKKTFINCPTQKSYSRPKNLSPSCQKLKRLKNVQNKIDWYFIKLIFDDDIKKLKQILLCSNQAFYFKFYFAFCKYFHSHHTKKNMKQNLWNEK